MFNNLIFILKIKIFVSNKLTKKKNSKKQNSCKP